MMKVVLFGATGYLGSHAAEQLIQAGYKVTCPVRASSDQRFLQKINAHIVAIDFSDEDSWAQLIDQKTTVINCIADTRSHASYEQRKSVEIDLTRQLFKLTQKQKAKRFIQLSTVMVYGFDRPACAIDESHPCLPRYIYNQIAVDREVILNRLYQANSTDLIILRPSNTVGKRDTSFLPNFLNAHKWGFFPIVAGGDWAFSCIDARDVGRALVHLLSVNVSRSETFLVKGFDTNWLDFKQDLDTYLRKSSTLLNLPKALMMGFAGILERIFPYGKTPPMTRFDMEVLSTVTLFDDSKIRATGFLPKYKVLDSFEDAIEKGGI